MSHICEDGACHLGCLAVAAEREADLQNELKHRKLAESLREHPIVQFDAAAITEGQLCKALEVDRVTARGIVIGFREVLDALEKVTAQ